jgi:hypothetical protein
MKAIWKYPINPYSTLQMPEGAKVLSVQTQDNQPQLWALVDPDKPKVGRTFAAVPTGDPFDDEGYTYIATFQIDNGGLVFHLFETTP